MGERFPSARIQGQALLATFQCLNLALFSAGEHQSMFRRQEIESDDVDEFFDELRIVAELEGLGAVRVKLW